MTIDTGGSTVQGAGGMPARLDVARIDTDERPVWETENLPDWVAYWLLPMLSGGQKWPEASEAGLSLLAQAYVALADGTISPAEAAGMAARTVVTGWVAPPTENFVVRARELFGHEGGLAGVTGNAQAFAVQADNFAIDTQHSKLAINVAFWITVIAIAIAIIVAFFSAGTSTALVGPYANAARAAISRILTRLTAAAGRELGTTRLARVSVLSGATGRGAITRLLASPIGRELPEEIGEEFVIGAVAQKQQMDMGTRKEYDWQKSAADVVGAAGGTVVGTKLAGPVSRVTRHVPGFAGRALTTGLTNTIASPFGSVLANAVVYGQWQNPLTADALLGGFLGGVGRTGSISPLSVDVATALTHPVSTLASAHDRAAMADAARAGGPGTASGANGGSPGPDGGQSGAAGAGRGPDQPAAPVATTPPASTGATALGSRAPAVPAASHAPASGQPAGQGARPGLPDLDASSQRRASASPDQPDQAPVAPAPDEDDDGREEAAPPRPETSAATGPPSRADGPAQPGHASRQTAPAPDQPVPAPDQPGAASDGSGSTSSAPAANPAEAATPEPAPATADATRQDDARTPTGGDRTSDGDAQARPAGDQARDGDARAAQQGDTGTPTGGGRAHEGDGRVRGGDGRTDETGDAVPVSALTSTAAPAALRARSALVDALGANFPDAVLTPTGDVIVPTAAGNRVIPATTMARVRAALNDRATQVATQAELEVEAAAMLMVAQAEDTLSAPAPATPPRATAGRPAPGTGPRATAGPPAPGSARTAAGPRAYAATGARADAGQGPTSRPGTVTARALPGTGFVPDGRQGPDLTVDETGAAASRLRTDLYLGEDVEEVTWLADRGLLRVRSRTLGTHYFRPQVGDLDPGLMARTELRSGVDADDPHLVRFAPRTAGDQLVRVWLHETTDILHLLADNRQEQLTRVRPRPMPATNESGRTRNACVPARLNELAFLTGEWRSAATMPEVRRLAVDIDGVRRELREHGHTPPPAPWEAQGERPTHAPPAPDEHADGEAVRSVIAALRTAEETLERQVDAYTTSAEKAGTQAAEARHTARQARKDRDDGRFGRARAARREARGHRAAQERHTRIAQSYAAALREVTEARKAYERLLTALNQAGRYPRAGEVSMSAIATSLRAEAKEAHKRYLEALRAALPQEIVLSASMPTGRLAHLGALTGKVNAILESNGVHRRFTPDELERALRGDWHKLVSDDGAVLRAGQGRSAGELRIKLTLGDLVEVLDPAVKASEMMVGVFFQAGRTVTATDSGSGGLSLGFDTKALAPLLEEGGPARAALELLGVGVGVSGGRNWSTSGGAGRYAQGGAVFTNRGDGLLFDGAAAYTVQFRGARDNAWSRPVTVDSGEPGDNAGQRVWVSPAYADQPPRRLAWIDDAKRDPAMPNNVVYGMSGLEGDLDALMAKLGGDFARVGTNAHADLRTFVTQELPARLREAVNGIDQVFAVAGEPQTRIRVKTEIVLATARPVGGRSPADWGEEVLVDFAASPGEASNGGSLEGNLSAGFNHPGLDQVDVFQSLGDYEPKLAGRAKGARAASQSYSSTANTQAIEVDVHRSMEDSLGFEVQVRRTYTVERAGQRPVTLPTRTGTVLLRMQEKAAYRFGLPVDDAALVRGPDGRPLIGPDGIEVLRGDPRVVPIRGRRTELPDWLGDGPGQIRGVGQGLVEAITGLDGMAKKVLDRLGKLGVVPEVVGGVPRYSSDPLTRASQMLNLPEVVAQLSERRLRTAYDQLAQDKGIHVSLPVHRVNGATRHYTLRLSLQQDFSDRGGYAGVTETKSVVKLHIGSDTSARGISRSRTYSGGPSGNESDGPDEGQDGLSHEVGVNAGGNRVRTAGSSTGSTVNVVTLSESGDQVALFDVKHTLKVELLHDGETTLLDSRDGSARLAFDANLLPPKVGSRPAPLGRLTDDVRARTTLLAMDAGPMLEAAARVVPQAMRGDSVAFHHMAAFVDTYNLTAHPEIFGGTISTEAGVRAGGPAPVRSSLSISAEPGQARIVAVSNQVLADILFGMRSAGVSWGGSSGLSFGMSTSMSDLDDGGTTSDGGKLSLPSRSGGTSVSTSILDILGNETIATKTSGLTFLILEDATYTLTGSEGRASVNPLEEGRVSADSGGTTTTTGTALRAIDGEEALAKYVEGRLDLPLHLVADAVERFRNGSLKLDRTLAVPLVQTYVKALAESRARGENPPPFAARHTPAALMEALDKVTGLGTTTVPDKQSKVARWFDRMLGRARRMIDDAAAVVLAPQYENAVGLGMVDEFSITDRKGTRVPLLDAVLNAVNRAVPGAEQNFPTLLKELRVDFGGKRRRIHVSDMWSPDGFEKSYNVRTGVQAKQAEVVTVRVRMEPVQRADGRRAKLVRRTKNGGLIIQRYRYVDVTHTEAYNGSYAAGLDYSAAANGDGTAEGLSADRSRSYSSSSNQQRTRVQRFGLFTGLDLVRQNMKIIIEVERSSARRRMPPGLSHAPRAAASIKKAADVVRRRRPISRTYDATLLRRIPTGMTRPEGEDPGPVATVTDPRQVELHPGHFPELLLHTPGKPTLLDIVSARLAKMLGVNTVAERRPELVTRLSQSALITGLEQMAGPDGAIMVPVVRQRFNDQGADVRVKARLSDFTVVAGPFEIEKGGVDRDAHAQNVAATRGRTAPVGLSGSLSDGANGGLGLDVGARAGEQASESIRDHHGARVERTMFERGKAYSVRLRVDYDLTFRHVARKRDGNTYGVGDPVHMPAATSGEAVVTLFGEEIEELLARMESGVRLAPAPDEPATFRHRPGRGRTGLIQILGDARLAARERGEVALVEVTEGNTTYRYRAHPDGTVRSGDGTRRAEDIDGGFAEAFSTLSPAILEAADRAGVDLREVFTRSTERGTFTQQVTAALRDAGAAPAAPADPVWPAPPPAPAASPAPPAAPAPNGTAGGSVAQGLTPPSATPPSVTSPEIPGTPYTATGRPDGVAPLSIAEIRGQNVTAADLGGAVAHLRWSGADRLVIQHHATSDEHVRVLAEDPGEGLTARTELHAGTADDPHVLRIAPGVEPLLVSSMLVHELSHLVQERRSGWRQGVVRESLAPEQAEGTDHCLTARLDEHAHLSGKWREAGDTRTRERLAPMIAAIAADIERRGLTPPPAPPWHTTPPSGAAPRTAGPNGPAGVGVDAAALARVRGLIDALTQASSPRGRRTLAEALNGTAPRRGRRRSLAEALNGGPTASEPAAPEPAAPGAAAPGPEVAARAGERDVPVTPAALRDEARRAGLAPGQPGAAARTAALARAGELTPEHVAALRGRPTLPEIATAKAAERAAALMGARVRTHGPGLLDIELPGQPPITVDVRPPRQDPPTGPDGEEGVLTYRVDDRRTIGANERAAAAMVAGAVARVLGLPVADHERVAMVHEAVRQVRAATPGQRPGRLGVLQEVAAAAPRRLLPAALAADLDRLLALPDPRVAHEQARRVRDHVAVTGWLPAEEECECPDDEPCTCGLRMIEHVMNSGSVRAS
ncbi:hypothetical protein [Nonomuraea candida]|uniref:WXG100-like domain-containing protein n=1 Tax=Nonomuraea candida TaxID=359159 RepID=UPI0005B7E080|nr:hypothetical protein [Nonomuraea candida]